jgi:hypothetical protein
LELPGAKIGPVPDPSYTHGAIAQNELPLTSIASLPLCDGM